MIGEQKPFSPQEEEWFKKGEQDETTEEAEEIDETEAEEEAA